MNWKTLADTERKWTHWEHAILEVEKYWEFEIKNEKNEMYNQLFWLMYGKFQNDFLKAYGVLKCIKVWYILVKYLVS